MFTPPVHLLRCTLSLISRSYEYYGTNEYNVVTASRWHRLNIHIYNRIDPPIEVNYMQHAENSCNIQRTACNVQRIALGQRLPCFDGLLLLTRQTLFLLSCLLPVKQDLPNGGNDGTHTKHTSGNGSMRSPGSYSNAELRWVTDFAKICRVLLYHNVTCKLPQ